MSKEDDYEKLAKELKHKRLSKKALKGIPHKNIDLSKKDIKKIVEVIKEWLK